MSVTIVSKMLLSILYAVMRSPLIFRYFKDGMLNFLSLWLYINCLYPGMSLVALRCTFFYVMHIHDLAAYSKCGLTRALNNCLNMASSIYAKDLLITPITEFHLLMECCICVLKFSLSSILTLKSFSFVIFSKVTISLLLSVKYKSLFILF